MRAPARCVCATLFVLNVLSAGWSLVSRPAQAAEFPTHTVRFVVPFPGGGTNDVLARIVADKLQARWGQPIVVENRTGPAATSAPNTPRRQKPDGHAC